MAELRASIGRLVISETTANELGTVKDLVIDTKERRISLVQVDAGRAGGLVAWADVSAFGEDAVMVKDDEVAHEARDDAQARALDGDFSVLDKLVLSDRGNTCGRLQDIDFDSDTGLLEALRTDSGSVEPVRLVGIGSYAVVIAAAESEAVSGY